MTTTTTTTTTTAAAAAVRGTAGAFSVWRAIVSRDRMRSDSQYSSTYHGNQSYGSSSAQSQHYDSRDQDRYGPAYNLQSQQQSQAQTQSVTHAQQPQPQQQQPPPPPPVQTSPVIVSG
jgi:hypothetical protein